MSLFDRTFLISTGVTAVICGAIYYYLNSKIRELEQALVKQNQVLSSFIANVQQEFRAMARANGMGANGGGSGVGENGMTFEMVTGSNELASPEALAAVAELDNRKIVITESVCDSSSEDDDSACETDASETCDSDSESDNDEEDEEHDNKLIICDLPVNDMKIIDMSSLGISQLEIYTPEKQSEDEADASEADASETDASEADASETDDIAEESDSEEDGFHRVTKLVIGDDNLIVSDLLKTTGKIEDIQIEELSTSDSVETPVPAPVPVPAHVPAPVPVETLVSKENPKYDDLKVDELRKVLLEKGLAQKEEVKKLKKNELLALLKKNII